MKNNSNSRHYGFLKNLKGQSAKLYLIGLSTLCAFCVTLLTLFQAREDASFTEELVKAQSILLEIQSGLIHHQYKPVQTSQNQESENFINFAAMPKSNTYQEYNGQYLRSQEYMQLYFKHLGEYEDIRLDCKNQLYTLKEKATSLIHQNEKYFSSDIEPMFRVWTELFDMAVKRRNTLNPQERLYLQDLMEKNQSYSIFLIQQNLKSPQSPLYLLNEALELENQWTVYNNRIYDLFKSDEAIFHSRENIAKVHISMKKELNSAMSVRIEKHKNAFLTFFGANMFVFLILAGSLFMLWITISGNAQVEKENENEDQDISQVETQYLLNTSIHKPTEMVNLLKDIEDLIQLARTTLNETKSRDQMSQYVYRDIKELQAKMEGFQNWKEEFSELRKKSEKLQQITEQMDQEAPREVSLDKINPSIRTILELEKEINAHLTKSESNYTHVNSEIQNSTEHIRKEMEKLQATMNSVENGMENIFKASEVLKKESQSLIDS